MRELFYKKRKKIYAMILVLVITLISFGGNRNTLSVNAEIQYITLYFVDKTQQKWISNDLPIIKAIDNTNNHQSYVMTQNDDVTWSVKIPSTAYNITFNRYSSDGVTQWNSWSAGGRNSNNTYFAQGHEYGYWGVKEENGFLAGDTVYLDISEFTAWENDNAVMYVNFSDVSKDDNYGNNINIASSSNTLYNPKNVDGRVLRYIYSYIVTEEDEGATNLRFWRGNEDTLWNCSVTLTYSDYINGNNCVKISGWNESGTICMKDNILEFEKDTDKDGLPDYYETYVTYTDPFLMSTDGSINDGDRDEDEDGLNNYQEYCILTNAQLYDTDYDGISDYEEVKQYYSDPKMYDTDGDGIGDWTEVQLGYNPLVCDSDDDGVLDGEDTITSYLCPNEYILLDSNKMGYEINIKMTGKGDYNNKISLCDATGDAQCPKLEYIVGKPLRIEHEDIEFDCAELTFLLNEEIIEKNNINNLQIASYDEKTHKIEFMDTVIDDENNKLSCKTEHFSYYFIVDILKLKFYYLINGIDTKSILSDVVFVIDTTGSMGGTVSEIKNSIVKVANETSILNLDVKYGLVEFRDISIDNGNFKSHNYGWFSNADDFKNTINNLTISGGGDAKESVVDALETARLSTYRNSSIKNIVVVTDNDYKEETNYENINSMEDEIELLLNDGIKVSVITDSSYYVCYQELVNETGGRYFNIDSDYVALLIEAFTTIQQTAKNYTWVRLSNGTVVKLLVDPEKATEDDPTDTDGDGIPDMQELTSKEEFEYMGEVYKIWNYETNPAINDTISVETNYDEIGDASNNIFTMYEMYEGVKEITSTFIVEFYEHYSNDPLASLPPEIYMNLSNNTMLYYLQESEYSTFMWNALTGFSDIGAIYNTLIESDIFSIGLNALYEKIILNIKENMLFCLKNNESLKKYKRAKVIDPISGNIIDFTHFAASCNVHYNRDCDIFHLPVELSSWGGDLQTLSADLVLESDSYSDEEFIKNVIKDIFLSNEYSFSEEDFFADIDAVNMSSLLKENYLMKAIKLYYIDLEVKQRCTMFLEYYDGKLKNKINDVLPDNIFDNDTFSPILRFENSMKIALGYLIHNYLSIHSADCNIWPSRMQIRLLKDYFYEYIVEQSDKEKIYEK